MKAVRHVQHRQVFLNLGPGLRFRDWNCPSPIMAEGFTGDSHSGVLYLLLCLGQGTSVSRILILYVESRTNGGLDRVVGSK